MNERAYEIVRGRYTPPIFDADQPLVHNVIVKFKKFRYGFFVDSDFLGSVELAQNWSRLMSFLEMLVGTEVLPNIDAWGTKNLRLLLQRRPGGGFSLSPLATADPVLFELEDHKHIPPAVLAFFHTPGMWVEENLFRKGLLGKVASSEVLLRHTLSKTAIVVSVTRDAEFTFDFSNYAPARLSSRSWSSSEYKLIVARYKKDRPIEDLRTRILNCFLALLGSVGRFQRRTTPHMWCIGRYIKKLNARGGSSGPGSPGTPPEIRKIKDFSDANRLYSTTVMERNTYPPLTVRQVQVALDLLDDILSRDDDRLLFEEVTLWHRAFHELNEGQCASSLLKSWLLIESIIVQTWQDYLTRQDRPFQDDRKPTKRLMDEGRKARMLKLSVAQVTDLLCLAGELPDHLLDETHRVREIRNNHVHQLARVEPEEAHLALGVSEVYFNLFKGLRLKSGYRPFEASNVLSWEDYVGEGSGLPQPLLVPAFLDAPDLTR